MRRAPPRRTAPRTRLRGSRDAASPRAANYPTLLLGRIQLKHVFWRIESYFLEDNHGLSSPRCSLKHRFSAGTTLFRNVLDNAPRRPRSPGPGFCMSRKPPVLRDFRRIVVKVGSSLVVDAEAGRLNQAWLASLAADIAGLHGKGRDVLVVSSGAIALGRSV